MAALVMGMLNAKSVFGVPAMASSFFNLGSIIGGVILGFLDGPAFWTARVDRARGGNLVRWRVAASLSSSRRWVGSAIVFTRIFVGATPASARSWR